MSDSFNPGTLAVVALVVLWLGYVLPRIAQRRSVLAEIESRRTEHLRLGGRDITPQLRKRQQEVATMPAKPTQMQVRQRRMLVLLLAANALCAALYAVSLLPLTLLVIVFSLLAAYVFALRSLAVRKRARQHLRTAQPTRPKHRSSLPGWVTAPHEEKTSAENSTETVGTREWTPVPVPAPAYQLRGEVEDLSARHDSYLRDVYSRELSQPKPFATSAQMPFEDEDLEEQEARAEWAEAAVASLPAAVDLQLDDVLERRRA
ncbi:hypothetical protein KRX53_08100 [Dermabacteraceae bacterium TAE3-ERU5]|nr:hypothetical protein [Dermabacteraceae bacterium TAE3-ERU5]